MATRFYLPSTGTPSIGPAFGAGWEVTTNADRGNLVTARISSAMTNKDGAGDAGVADQLLRQYVSAALAAQTLSGTIKGVMRCASNVTNVGVGAPAFRLAKCNSDGSVVTEILGVTVSPLAATNAPPATSGTTLTNRRLETSPSDTFVISFSDTTIEAGDRLIVELGYKDNTTDTGRFVRISFGDDSAIDLPEDETTTTADNPWVEFSANITFASAEQAPTKGGLAITREVRQRMQPQAMLSAGVAPADVIAHVPMPLGIIARPIDRRITQQALAFSGVAAADVLPAPPPPMGIIVSPQPQRTVVPAVLFSMRPADLTPAAAPPMQALIVRALSPRSFTAPMLHSGVLTAVALIGSNHRIVRVDSHSRAVTVASRSRTVTVGPA